MAVKRRVNWLSQQRVDCNDLRSIESAASNDFDELMQTLYLGTIVPGGAEGEGFIYRGFEISMTGLIGGAASNAKMIVAQSAILHSKSSQSGTFLYVRPGTAPQTLNSATNTNVQGAFTPNSLNYVGIEYIRFLDDATSAQVYIWDPTLNDETIKVAPRAQILKYNIIITTGTWAANVLPVCIITTDSGNNVTFIEDTRRLMNRLGTAGRTTPNPSYSYPWTAQSEGRVESPFISSSNGVNPFHGGDKMLGTEKDWKDAVMSVIKEIKGSAFWYSSGSSSITNINLSDLFFDSASSILTMRGKFIHSKVTPGMLTWSGDLFLDSIIGPLRYKIAANNVTLSDGQVAYITLVRNNDFQAANTFSFTNGSATVTASSSVSGISPGDWIKFFSDDISKWAQISTIVGSNITLTAVYQGSTASGKALKDQYLYTMSVASPQNVPASGNTYWIAKRDDNGSITATIAAAPTGASRTSGVTTFTTTANHGINAGQGVQVAGVTDTTFNGFFEVISTPTLTTFTVTNTGADGTSGSGTVNSTATIYLRGVGELTQGSSTSDDSSALEALLQYTGSAYAGDTQPQYSSTNFVTQGIDLTSAIGQLDGQAGIGSLISKQDRNFKLVRGGDWSFNGSTGVLTWSDDAFIQIPGLLESRNRIPAGSVTLNADGKVAYVELNRSGSTPATLSVSTAQINTLTPTNNTAIIARQLNGVTGVAAGTQVASVSDTTVVRDFISGTKLYTADANGLSIFDISSTTPSLLGTLTLSSGGNCVFVSGIYAYVGHGTTVSIIDISVPSAPVEVGSNVFSGANAVRETLVSGVNLFVLTKATSTDNGIVWQYDVSTPSSPLFVATNGVYTGGGNGGGMLAISGTTLYLATGTKINIFDTTSSLALQSPYTTGITTTCNSIIVSGTHLYFGNGTTFGVTDITSPLAPTFVTSIVDSVSIFRMALHGNTIFTSFTGTSVSWIDISTPATPNVIFASSSSAASSDIASNGTYAYVVGSSTVVVLQVSATIGDIVVIVGTHSFRLVDGESKELDAGLSIENRTYTGAVSEADSSPVYTSTINISDGDALNTSIGELDNILSNLTNNQVLLGGGPGAPIKPIAPGTLGNVLTSNGSSWISATPAASPVSSLELSNLGLLASVAANALTIALKQADGTTNPSTGTAAVKIGFRSSTLTSGAFNQRLTTSALSVVAPNGASFGLADAAFQYIYIYAIDNAGTVELAFSGIKTFDEGKLYSTTALSASSDDNETLYSTTARSNVPIRLIGKVGVNETVAGTYASAPSELAVMPVENDFPDSEVFIVGGNPSTHGGSSSGDTFIRNFVAANVIARGTGITYVARTTTTADKFVINKTGMYTIDYTDASSTGATSGVTVNAANTSTANTDPSNLASRKANMAVSAAGANQPVHTGATLFLRAGDVVRCHSDSTTTPDATQPDQVMFRVTQIA